MALSDKQIITTLFKDKLSVGNTRMNREFFEEALKSSFVVKPQNLWMYGDMIPAEGTPESELQAIKQMQDGDIHLYDKDESTSVPLFKKYVDLELQPIDNGTDNAFKLVEKVNGIDQIITDVIPFNFYKNIYNYTLKTSNGDIIPFGVGDWVFDTFSSILTFNGDLPSGVDHLHCPKFTFYRYIGGKGFRNDMHGYEAALVPITGIHIPSNTFTFYTGTDGHSLQEDIISQANKVEDQFVKSYGWDGADNNEGIATSLEVLSPLTYSESKDKVKGYDESKDSHIYVLLTKAFLDGPIDDDTAPEIKFISNKVIEGEHKLAVSIHEDARSYISFDDGPEKLVEYESEMILCGKDRGFIVLDIPALLGASDGQSDYIYNFKVKYDLEKTTFGNTQAGLFYYSIKEGTLLPFHTKEDNIYDISFPVVTIIGKIPPSVKLNAITLDSLDDTITPDYYGPRVYNVVIAQEDTEQIKSADYVVKNSKGFYVKDIFERIQEDKSAGNIYFRAGNYEIIDPDTDNKILDKSLFNFGSGIIFHGEDKQLVKIYSSNLTVLNIDSEYLTSFQNIEFDNNITLNITINGPVTLNYIKAKTVNVIRTTDSAFSIAHSEITNLNISGDSTSKYFISDSSITNLKVDSSDGILNNIISQSISVSKFTQIIGCTLGQCSFDSDAQVTGSIITNLLSKSEKALFRDCYIEKYDENIEDIQGVPRLNTFPIFNKNGLLKYANLANPVSYDTTTNTFSVKYDKKTIFINEDGELMVAMDASQIAVKDAEKWERDAGYTESKGDISEEQADETHKMFNKLEPGITTVEEIFKYIMKYKADLINGKIPLPQLPDSVAYGGLHYCGLWSVEATHRLPSFEDIKTDALLANYDKDVNELQPGWFCIIDNSTLEEHNPTKVQKLSAKSADNSNGLSQNDLLLETLLKEEYTAGDWIIFEGYENKDGTRVLDEDGQPIPIWSKIDRSYQNPVFTRLPSRDPNGLHWTWEDGGTGTLDFDDDTIYEALYEINNELNKLKVQRPYLLEKFQFIPEKDYPKIKVRQVIDNPKSDYAYIGDEAEFFDIDNIEKFATTTSLDNDWRSYIYFGSQADFTGTIRFENNTPHKYVFEKYIGVGRTDGAFVIDDARDPFANEVIGRGYWKGTKLHLNLTDLQQGSYALFATEENIGPLNTIAMQTSSVSHFDFAHSQQEIKANVNLLTVPPALNIEDLTKYYVKYTSGIPFISTTAVDNYGQKAAYKVSFQIDAGLYKYLNTDKFVEYHTSFDKPDEWHSFEELKSNSASVTIKKSNYTDYYDLTVDQLSCPIPEDTIGLHQFSLTLRIYNILGEFEDLIVYTRPVSDLIGTIYEPHRVCSGQRIDGIDETNNPDYTSGSSTIGFAGDSYITNESIKDNIELMCENYIKEDGTIGSHYIWPKGEYHNISDTETYDYNALAADGQIMADGTIMRYVTFATTDIQNSNGFMLKINGSGMTMNTLTGVNENMSIQILVDGTNIWYNANKPMGYLEDPVNANDPCLYAGKSTVYEKRISFGQTLLSGKVIVRIGITNDSNIAIDNIEIKDIV